MRLFVALYITSFIITSGNSQYQQQGFRYLGCFEDGENRKLRGEYRVFEYMTQQMCLTYCKNRFFTYAGLQNGKECFCGDEPPQDYNRKPESGCNINCVGERETKCGGDLRNAVYSTGAVLPEHEYVGCYVDESNIKLKGFFTELDDMTPRSCIDRCRDLSFKYAGLENRVECFCGNEEPSSFNRRNDCQCSATCPGDYTSKCGAIGRMSLYKTLIAWNSSLDFRYSDYQYLGCFDDEVEQMLRGEFIKFSYMTQQMCMSYCKKRSFRYAGLQNGVQCFCGDEIPYRAYRKPESHCNVDCPGENLVRCGGSYRNAIYSTGAVPPKHEYLGYLDERDRKLKGFFTFIRNLLTPRTCIDLCRNMFFKYAGLQNGVDCFCGNEELSILDRRSDSECHVKCSGDFTSRCGGPWRLTVYKTLIASDSSVEIPYSDYQYLGCFEDPGKLKLTGEYRKFSYMTHQMCMNYCKKGLFKYAGLHNGFECYCGDEIPNETHRKLESDCNTDCSGENTMKCGGNWTNAIYSTGAVPPKHEYVGCYRDDKNRRLKGFFTELKSMTPRSCINLCRDLSFKYAGLQIGDECFCGNEDPSISDRRNDSDCHAECSGDYTSKCGGHWRNSVYKTLLTSNSFLDFRYSDYQYLGCFQDDAKERKLRGEFRTFTYMTQQMCMSYCKKKSFKYAGLQNGYECYCGDETPNKAHRKSESDCNKDCSGENTMKCGGDWLNAIYSTGAVPPKHEYVGCYLDDENRKLKGFYTVMESMTPRSCIDLCRDMSFKYAGLQIGKECYCGDGPPRDQPESDCNINCAGERETKCGGDGRNAVYSTGAESSQYQQQGFRYLGCFEDGEKRTLRGEYRLFAYMTQQMCLTYCKNRFFTYAGLQNGKECFCGDEPPQDYNRKPESDCNINCVGERETKCGGDLRNAVYSTGAVPPEHEYVGCYVDEINRKLKGFFTKLDDMTPRSCIDRCRDLSFKYAGLENRVECFCGNEEPSSFNRRNDNECDATCPGDYTSKCGAIGRMSLYKTLIAWNSSLEFRYSDYQYLGCFDDKIEQMLRGEFIKFSYMTQQMCMSYCKKRSFRYAGLQNGVQCFCGDEIPYRAYRKPESHCNVDCPGENLVRCGGSYRNAIYSTGAVPPKHEYLGCYLDERDRKLKGFFTFIRNLLTPRSCIDLCRNMFFKYAGLENGVDCFCGNEELSILDRRSDSECDVKCSGDFTSKCGGPWRLTVYKTLIASDSSVEIPYSDYQYLGCFEDPGKLKLTGEYRKFSYMTHQMCMNYCKKGLFKYAGLQNGFECYCGDEIPNVTHRKLESDCNTDCSGENTMKCGGNWTNAIYSTGAVPPKHEYVGCYRDDKNRRLKGFFTELKSMTPRSCINLCRDMSFKYAGLQIGDECFCGNEDPSISDRRNDSECHAECSGDYTSKCGGHWRNSVYKTLLTSNSFLDFRYSDYQYLGCFQDDAKERKLRGEFRTFTYMTQQMCMSYCKKKSFKYAGLQNGYECYCGDETPNKAHRKSESDCNTDCSGENTMKCGGDWLNAIYSTGAVPPKHEYVGCYLDDENRKLKGFYTVMESMTPRSCIDLCRDMSFKYAGLQIGNECFCGNEEPIMSDRRSDIECRVECKGDYLSICGGHWRNSVYKTLIARDESLCTFS